MSFFAGLRGILAKPLPKSEPGGDVVERVAVDEAQLEAVDTALNELTARREEAREIVKEAGGQRRAALFADDLAAVKAVDRKLELAHMVLEQCEVFEGELLERRQALLSEARRRRVEHFAARYRDVAFSYIDALTEAHRLLAAIHALWHEAAAEGLGAETRRIMGDPLRLVDAERIEAFRVRVEAATGPAGAADLRAGAPQAFPIRFLVPTGLFTTGEIGGFPGDQAWRFVNAGVGEWADPKNIPPAPPPDPRSAATPAPAADGTVKVRFLSPTTVGQHDAPGFRTGEQASFPADVAERLVRAGRAVYADEGGSQ